MSTEELKRELVRIGETAPVADVPADTWSKAQRSRRREQLAVVAAVVAVIAVIGGLVTWVPDRSSPQPADGAGAGVPDHIWAVPSDGPASETDLSVGRASVAYTFNDFYLGDRVVVIGAEDGAYHPLDLPQFAGRYPVMSNSGQYAALSPDGGSLAYYFMGSAPESPRDAGPTGLRVVDLETGKSRTVSLTGDQGVLVTSLSWSPDSRWLVWSGQVIKRWTENGRSYGHQLGGRVAPGSTTSEALPRPPSWQAAGISDSGDVVTVGSQVLRWDGEQLTRTPVGTDLGGSFALSTRVTDVVTHLRSSTGQQLLVQFGDPERQATTTAGRSLSALGWMDDTAVVASGPANGSYTELPLGLVSFPTDGTRATYRSVGTIESGAENVSLATDLMTEDRPTVEMPRPDFVGSGTSWWIYASIGGVAALLLGMGLAIWQRRRRTVSRSLPW